MADQPRPRKYRVCILEDDAAVFDSLRLTLERFGYEVSGFASAGEFLASGRPDSFDCLIVDHRLPVLSGLELIEVLRGRAYSKPAVLVWGQPEAHLLPRIHRAAINATLTKPLIPECLMLAVAHAIRYPSTELRT